MRYHHGYTTREEKATLNAGLAAHAALAAFLDPRGQAPGDAAFALQVFSDHYEAWATANVEPSHRLAWPNVRRIMERWFAEHPLDALPFTVEHVEIGFTFPLTAELTACGRMDGLVRMNTTGDRYVFETKTTATVTPWWLEDFFLDSQLSHYESGARDHLDGATVKGTILNAIEFRKLPASKSKCREHGRPYEECGILHAKFEMPFVERAPAILEEWRKTAIHLGNRWRELTTRFPRLEDIPRVRTQGTFIRGMCAGCEFKTWCQAGRPLELVDQMFEKSPWNPLEHAVAGREQPVSALAL